jgi:hypothetical protein
MTKAVFSLNIESSWVASLKRRLADIGWFALLRHCSCGTDIWQGASPSILLCQFSQLREQKSPGLIAYDVQRAIAPGDPEFVFVQSLHTVSIPIASVVERISDIDKLVEIQRGILAKPKDNVLVRWESRFVAGTLGSGFIGNNRQLGWRQHIFVPGDSFSLHFVSPLRRNAAYETI